MGLFFTVVYIVLTIISPAQFGSAWADYHAMVYLAVLTTLFSLPNVFSRSSLLSSVQTYLVLALIVVVGVSQIANHWLGGAINAWLTFLPSAAVFFFIVANATSLRRLKIIIVATVAACLALVAEAFCGYYFGFLGNTFFMGQNVDADSGQVVDHILRLRAVGFLHDPNDFSQMLIIVIALLFIAWRQGRILTNTLFVLTPSAVFLWAIYLTHSRGALIGLAVLLLMAGYKRIGKVPALVLSGIFGLGLMALDFTGGRAIDASAGADRLELWAEGIESFKHSPIFGIGFGNIDLSGHTAHNSFVLPLVELGILGATIFVALLVTTTMDLNRLIALREAPASDAPSPSPAHPENDSLAPNAFAPDSLDNDARRDDPPAGRTSFAFSLAPAYASDVPSEPTALAFAMPDDDPSISAAQLRASLVDESLASQPDWLSDAPSAQLADSPLLAQSAAAPAPSVAAFLADNPLLNIRAALFTFMVTAWFLSRTYDVTTYLVLGLAVAAINLDPAAAEPRDHRRWIAWTFAVEAVMTVFIYLVVRLRH
jgi:putative inorganic carbon (hco3(-)) transporter